MKQLNLKSRSMIAGTTVLLLLGMLVFGTQGAFASSEPQVLARVEVVAPIDQLGLPVHAHLQNSAGQDYVLTVATESQLKAAGAGYSVLDEIGAVPDGGAYLIALERIDGARSLAPGLVDVLLDDGRHIIVRAEPQQAEFLTELGFDIEWLPMVPMVFTNLTAAQMEAMSAAVPYDPNVAQMINAVDQNTVYNRTSGLTGETPVTIGGSSYTITSRNTQSGTPIEKATQYVYEFMQNMGYTVSYHNWSSGFYSGRNVVGEKIGSTSPDEVVLITAHLDNMPSSGAAPGADDNGSGSVGVMMAADIFQQYDFERTLRFVFFTGEEQGLLGSKAYAQKISSSGDNVQAVYNMDMIAWDNLGGPDLRIHTRTSNNPGYQADMALANTFVEVVNTYDLQSALTPIIDSDGISASDHASFWNKGFAAVLAIEDDENDFCDYYHTSNDRLSTLNMTYYTNYIKASVGTAAHFAKPVGEAALKANFTFTANDLTVDFTDTSTAGANPITDWFWDFGDGGTSSQQNPVYTYAQAGTFTVELTVTDSGGGSDTASKSVTVGSTPTYCDSTGQNYSYEWVAQVDVGALSNPSNAAGYSDFTAETVNLTKGQAASVALSPGFSSSSYTEYWKIWIDLNRDGVFGADEELFSKSGASTVTGMLTVPASALTGPTRMRVSMKYNASPTACETFQYGEVEDYTANISEGTPVPQYDLAVNIAGQGSVALNPPGGSYDQGTSVSLTATPASGYSFDGWSGDLTGTANPAAITMDADKNVTATFTASVPDPDSCVGYCGDKAPGGCWCDSACESYGDCCPDKVQVCGQ